MAHFVTGVGRPCWAVRVYRSICREMLGRDWRWWVAHDDQLVLPKLLYQDSRVSVISVRHPPVPIYPAEGPYALFHYGNPMRNAALAALEQAALPGVISFLDDDTEVHPAWPSLLAAFEQHHYPFGAIGFVVWQEYRDGTPRMVWERDSQPENLVDTGMFHFHSEAIAGLRWPEDGSLPAICWYSGDREFFNPLWVRHRDRIWVCPKMGSLYNSLKQETGISSVPLGHPAWSTVVQPWMGREPLR